MAGVIRDNPMLPLLRLKILSSAILVAFLMLKVTVADNTSNKGLMVDLAYKFDEARVKAISPDGKKLLIVDWGIEGHPLRLIEIGSWETISSYDFKVRISSAFFFADSQAIKICDNDINQIFLDLQTGERTILKKGDPRILDVSMYPVHDRNLLVRNYDEGDLPYTKELALVKFPSFEILKRVPYATQPREAPPKENWKKPTAEYFFIISDNKEVLAYSFDHVLVCRRTEDLEILRTWKIEPPLEAYGLHLSPNGQYIAAEIANELYKPKRKVYFISVFSVKTGVEIARLPLKDSTSYAISPDGSLLAVSDRELDKKSNEWILITNIYELSSRNKLASVQHDRIKNRAHFEIETDFSTIFTPDGQYLITSGMNTKIWKIKRISVDVKVTPQGIVTEE